MIILSISIVIFIVLEFANIMILYFKPDSRVGNGVAVFKAWEDSKQDENLHLFVRYMTNWVAGTKLIFIFLLLVILFIGSETIKMVSVIAMILSISTYFWRLHPLIVKLDMKGEIIPKGYSKQLRTMITGFLGLFIIALVIYFIMR
ncbi:MAG: hypothetical protein HGB31_02405 [Erysipelotrichaceae bacterium]|nr:hypothetical protein [Erysipelotrichaceae bacterium]